ncbi:MAG: hypothetical protein A4E49_02374 [Methanosaeta sp. PtaU1.Bin112]|nr:MAG: hypothetical protein A4E49_02374 [Methanosaeta sp. PtaU1.Bin112]
MGKKFSLICLLLLVSALSTSADAIEYLRGTTFWDVAEIKGITAEEFHPLPWVFRSSDANANEGTVEVQNSWFGAWKEVGCNTIYCQITSGGKDSWYLAFVNPKYFIAYKEQGGHYYLYRLGKMKGEPYGPNTIVGYYPGWSGF